MGHHRSQPPERSTSRTKRLRDHDAAARTRFLKVAAWSLFPAVFMGGAVSLKAGALAGVGAFVLVALVAGGGSLIVAELAAAAAGRLLHPSGGRRRPEYSGPASLAARGLLREAVSAYEAASHEFPDDPVPCLEAARIRAGPLGDTEGALRWFRHARARGIPRGEARVVIREMVEAAERGGNGLLAAPDLARYADERDGTAEGAWARERLAALKAGLRPEGEPQ